MKKILVSISAIILLGGLVNAGTVQPGNNIPTATPTATWFTPEPAGTMVTPYFTPAPKLDCVRVVWNKGTYAKGLNIRPGPTLHNFAPVGTYLGTGFTFRPLAVLVNAEGTFYKLAEPNWWVAGKLNSHPQNKYIKVVTCP